MTSTPSTPTEFKRCTKCAADKPRSDFHKRASAKDGLRNLCKPCVAAYAKAYYLDKKAGVDRAAAPTGKTYYMAKHCPACNTTLPLDAFNKMTSSPDGRQNRCRACANQASRSWYSVNAKTVKPQRKARRAANRDKELQNNRDWKARNRDRVRADVGMRNSIRAGGRLPEAKTTSQILDETTPLYREARIRTEQTGVAFDVDHIEPSFLGGLHDVSNLRVITASENRNRWNYIELSPQEIMDTLATKGLLSTPAADNHVVDELEAFGLDDSPDAADHFQELLRFLPRMCRDTAIMALQTIIDVGEPKQVSLAVKALRDLRRCPDGRPALVGL